MAMTDKLSITLTGLGEFHCTADEMDRTIAHYLPASPAGLRQKIDNHPNNTDRSGHYDRLITVTEYLMVLAYLDSRPDDDDPQVCEDFCGLHVSHEPPCKES